MRTGADPPPLPLPRRGGEWRRIRLWVLVLALEVAALTTPAVEWVAGPLLVAPRLTHADAIVVLGSGVRPGGHPTRWAEERIRYGAQLYREGYASHLIFSGGQTRASLRDPVSLLEWWITGNHSQLEAETYAVFAKETLGVPGSVIALEDRSQTTYENGLWTAGLLRRKHWQHILLVTSSTHMRRALGVFNRLGVMVDPAPVPASILYARSPSHRFEAWRAVLHEYLGLVIYRIQGRI